jgi:hypothetical protein
MGKRLLYSTLSSEETAELAGIGLDTSNGVSEVQVHPGYALTALDGDQTRPRQCRRCTGL